MVNKSSLSKVLNFRVNQLNECSQKFKRTLDDYVRQITGSARTWIERSEDCNQQQFVEITVQLDQAMMLLMESTAEIESNMADQPLGTGAARTARISATESSHQANVEAQGLDQSLRSLLERLDTFQNVTDMVQELKTDLDSCKSVMDSVEEMRARLENSASQSEMQMINSRLQKVQKEFDKYQGKKFSQVQIFEKRLSKMEQTFSKTDSQVKGVVNFVNVFNECLGNSSEPEDQLPSEEKESTKIKIKPCTTLPDGLSKLVDRLSLLETASDNTDDTVKTIEGKLAELVTRTELMKAQIALEIDTREKGSSHVTAIREQLSVLKLDIPDLKEHKLGTDERAQSEKDMCQALVEVDSAKSNLSSHSSAADDDDDDDETASDNDQTGVCVHSMIDIKKGTPSDRLPWSVLNTGVDGGFDDETGVFTAPVDGIYLVILAHFQIGSRPTTISVILTEKNEEWRDRVMITTMTTKQYDYVVREGCLVMCAGDTFRLSLPEKDCLYEIPVFSCVCIGCIKDVRLYMGVHVSGRTL